MNDIQNHTPMVSVIIPTFNRAHIITHSIESVLKQTFIDYEIIVVDDGSSDSTAEHLHLQYGKKIVYIRKEHNQGLSSARNTGIEAARGKYVAFLDDDDRWLPEKLKMQVSLMEKKHSLGLAYCNSYTLNENNELISEMKGTRRGFIFDDLLIGNCLGPPSGVLLRKKVFKEAGYFDESLSALEDWDLWIRVSKFYEVDFIDRPLVNYLVHDDNMSKNLMNMERCTFTVLDKYWSPICKEKRNEQKRNAVYSSHCINFAWKQYCLGDRVAFRNLIMKALNYDPLHLVVVQGSDLQVKEEALFEVFNVFWHQRNEPGNTARKKAFTSHYIQLAWEYYHQGRMSDFRRCLCLASYNSFPKVTLRLIVPFLKSFMGKGIAEGIHEVRKKFMHVRQ